MFIHEKEKIISYFSYNGKKIYYEEHGSGEALTLLHGNTVSGKFFTPVIPILAEKYHVITLDFLECGQSDRMNKRPADLRYEWSGEFVALCDELKLSKVKRIGCSGITEQIRMGQNFAKQNEDFRSIL